MGGQHFSGETGRIIAFEGVLELQQDILAPQDNFTLSVFIVNDNYERTTQTEGGNLTANESASATLQLDNMNSGEKTEF